MKPKPKLSASISRTKPDPRRRRVLSNRTSSPGKARERRCVASGQVRDEAELIRLALGPGDQVVPDLAAKLPGRGAWVSADRAMVDLMVRKGLLNRAFGCKVELPDDLAGLLEAQLAARALSLIGLARRSGDLATGFDAVRLALKGARPAWRLEASDGAADGRSKLDRLTWSAWGEVPVAGCFLAEEIGAAAGRGPVVHAAMAQGSQARSFGTVIAKLAGFRDIDPARPAKAGAEAGHAD
ncbi:RNA-binding protein [Maricaulis sp. CAU 1757]